MPQNLGAKLLQSPAEQVGEQFVAEDAAAQRDGAQVGFLHRPLDSGGPGRGQRFVKEQRQFVRRSIVSRAVCDFSNQGRQINFDQAVGFSQPIGLFQQSNRVS